MKELTERRVFRDNPHGTFWRREELIILPLSSPIRRDFGYTRTRSQLAGK